MAVELDTWGDEFQVDPDELKVPENPLHRQVTDVISVVATELLNRDVRLFRDMNWYPTDGGNVIAPDIMVIAADAVPVGDKSYKQHKIGGPLPSVVVEIPSDTDTFDSMMDKLERYSSLGVPAYVVRLRPQANAVTRHPPGENAVIHGMNPIPELGGLAIDTTGEVPVVVSPDGERVQSDHQWASRHMAKLEAMEVQAEQMTARVEEMAARVAQLEAKLREAGIDPEC